MNYINKNFSYFFLTPLYNDWKSFNKLLKNLNNELKKKKRVASVIIINDNSSSIEKIIYKKNKNIKKIVILNLKKNLGSQKAIFIGLHYLKNLKHENILTILDSDGEDDVKKINNLIAMAEANLDKIIIANREKRLEGFFLKFLNKIRLYITYILTGYYINFGNFSSFHTKNLKKLLTNNNLWIAYSSGILKNFNKFIYINTKKQKRYFGHSKVNYSFLLNHSLNINCIFWKKIIFKSLAVFIMCIVFFKKSFLVIVSILLVFLNFLILLKFFKNYNHFPIKNYIKNKIVLKNF